MESEKRPRGRPGGKNFEFIKSIKLNQNQVNNWDSKRIKTFLDGSQEPNNSEVMDKFKRLYEIMNLWLIGKMTLAQRSNIPENIIEEIELIEEGFNFE